MTIAAKHPPLSWVLVALFNALFARGRPGTFAHALIGRGSAAKFHLIDAGREISFIPGWLLGELEYHTPGDIRISVATTDHGATPDIRTRDLGACFAELPLEPVYERSQWAVPDATYDDAIARLEAFKVPPPIVLDNGWSLLALWPLATSLRVDENPGRAEALQCGLASALGGRADAISAVARQSWLLEPAVVPTAGVHPAWSLRWPVLRVPGSRNHDRGAHGALVTVARFSEQRIDLADLDAALA